MNKPTIVNALIALGFKSGWKIKDGKIVKWWNEKKQPTEQAIQEKLNQLQSEYESLDYARKRKIEFDENFPIADQLDYIFHHGIEKWKTDIVQSVKEKYPKPS